MKVTVCIGSSCHLKGSRQVVEALQGLIADNDLKNSVELGGTFCIQLDQIVGDTGAIRNLVIYFFVANEGISILENWGSMGLPLPEKVMEVLEQLKKDNGGK